MKELIAFILPPAVALAGARMNRAFLGKAIETQFGAGARFAFGLATGMLVFSQAVLLAAILGVNAASWFAWLAMVWGVVELAVLGTSALASLRRINLRAGHMWLLLLLPVLFSWWVFGRLSVLQGTKEFDAVAFWIFKSKILYLNQGWDLLSWLHEPTLAYAHWEYPLLVPCLYTLGYGAVGGVNEFINKVWPFWMVVALSLAILSMGKVWRRPQPLPIATVIILCLLPASLQFVQMEGGTMPMVFYVVLASLLLVRALSRSDILALATAIPVLVGCAATKLEGIVYVAVWLCVLLPGCWRRSWLKNPLLLKPAVLGAACLLPYILFRLTGPILHPESEWWRSAIASPVTAFQHFPQVWFLNVGDRFFHEEFFRWTVNGNGNLEWAGHWGGWISFVDRELTILPWLILLLLVISWWSRRHRLAVASLTVVTFGVLTILAFVIACLPRTQTDPSLLIDFSTDNVARYYYPFFMAWFIGLAALWFPEDEGQSESMTGSKTGQPVVEAKTGNPP